MTSKKEKEIKCPPTKKRYSQEESNNNNISETGHMFMFSHTYRQIILWNKGAKGFILQEKITVCLDQIQQERTRRLLEKRTLSLCLLSLSQKLKAPSDPAVAKVWCIWTQRHQIRPYTKEYKIHTFQKEILGFRV